MREQENRRSSRVKLKLPIQISGTNAMGGGFIEHGLAEVVNRHGAKIYLTNALVRDQEIRVLSLATGREANARVRGLIGKEPKGYCYGIQLLDVEVNIWGIEFLLLPESRRFVRMLLECVRCHTEELVILNEFEVEVLGANNSFSKDCSRCKDINPWQLASSLTEWPE